MKQIKLFKGVENNMAELEADVNSWIQQSGANVIGITGNIAPQSDAKAGASTGGLSQGSFSPSDILLIVTYEK